MTVSRAEQKVSIGEGTLYIVATPIGNLQDMSPRARQVLQSVNLILAEDTRTSGHLLREFGISTPLLAYHDHNERQLYQAVIARLEAGENIALITDAGTPLISDPGYALVRAAHENGLRLVPVPGPCAVIAALAVSGLPSDRFVFEGFLPKSASARRRRLKQLSQEPRTIVFFEAPHRILDSIADMCATFGPDRMATLARELTKLHETVHFDSLKRILSWLHSDENRRKGEFVVVVEGAGKQVKPEIEIGRVLTILLKYLPASQAAAAASELLGGDRNRVYQLALKLSGKQKTGSTCAAPKRQSP